MKNDHDHDKIRKNVRNRYAGIAMAKNKGCCSASCCSSSPASGADESAKIGYSVRDMQAVPEGSNMGLGCGNPQAIANLKEGEVVVDLGSGCGFDCFLAARKVGAGGRVIGIDMTPEMVSKARENTVKGKYKNVEFRLGEIEHLPVADNSVDVIISNCVINLSPDKKQVFREASRVLKQGGRLAISDVVAVKELPDHVKMDMAAHSGCVAGAALVADTKAMLADAGFSGVKVDINEASREFIKHWFPGTGIEAYVVSAKIEAVKVKQEERAVTTNNDGSKPTNNMELVKEEAAACGPGCGCHACGFSGRTRWIAGVIVLVAAGVLMARAVMKSNSATTAKTASEYASLPAVVQAPVSGTVSATHETHAAPAAVAVKEIGALSELNAMAADTGGVFVFLAGKDDPIIKAPLVQMRSAAKTIEAQSQNKISIFRLKTDSQDYVQVAAQMPVPGVIAMVKGRGMVPVSGDITEAKLIQGFVAASTGGGCGPSGCGPGECN